MVVRKINERYMLIEYPVTLNEMEQMSLDLPKTERTYYEYAFKELNKVKNVLSEIFPNTI